MAKKKFIQACDMTGSIYGKKSTLNMRKTIDKKTTDSKEDSINSYSKLYKQQYLVMDKFFRRDK